MLEYIREEKNNLQGGYLERVKYFVGKEIIGREETYWTGRGYSELKNILQGKHYTVQMKLLLGEKKYAREKRENMLEMTNILIEKYSDRERFVMRKIIER